ncbi:MULTISPECIES: peptide chain release factor 1 [Terrabacteria group]|uniref:peptide chain release factor 1 n=1 Tax=Bacillati TaxID=1783272 RepID=UPI0019392AC7|nr:MULTISPECIES: peptide chain release factor 1 [Terrabacteria group]MBW9212930.1 peptide chain release factor 1 [Trueperella sp. zg.1013]QRG86990.1 peptide chain release factor 1 [Bulleidia sp. zg-1006]
MDAVREKLIEIEKRYQTITNDLMDEKVFSNPALLTKLSKEQASLTQSLEAWHKLKKLDNQIEQANEMLKESDPELKEMAKMELEECVPAQEELLEHIQHLLIPKDPDDDHDVIMEIRGGAGGDEGNIFAGDLYRMYIRYAEAKGWKIQVMEASASEAGGFSQVIFSIKGNEVYRDLKWESGVHRVQRVPKTESQGRVHTSTATVLCQPEAEEADIVIDPSDLTIETHRASGAGGQHINKTDSAVRIVHLPTGITVNCQDGRSQIENRETAMRLIRARVYEEIKRQRDEAAGAVRRAKIGTGDRSEKIRTYNYPQNRVTDHRIGLTITQLDRIMEGKLDGIIEGLQAEEEKRKLEESQG